ncbi:hypothetical protein AMJ49_03535 [Parcubacteria bacterium DG_74_2]|nr:MAG: hypothetical protein AMJ49_03535 [Parcubacteria bacterium DG_74_2]
MRCEICGGVLGKIVVSLPLKKRDGSLNTLACLKCAKKSSVYCKKHRKPHLGFIDDTTACVACIEEMVAKNRPKEINIYNNLRQNLPSAEFERLLDWADVSSFITKNSRKTCILRAIATRAIRSKQDIEAVFEKIMNDKSVNYILPLKE